MHSDKFFISYGTYDAGFRDVISIISRESHDKIVMSIVFNVITKEDSAYEILESAGVPTRMKIHKLSSVDRYGDISEEDQNTFLTAAIYQHDLVFMSEEFHKKLKPLQYHNTTLDLSRYMRYHAESKSCIFDRNETYFKKRD